METNVTKISKNDVRLKIDFANGFFFSHSVHLILHYTYHTILPESLSIAAASVAVKAAYLQNRRSSQQRVSNVSSK
jgi:hypothetical protein